MKMSRISSLVFMETLVLKEIMFMFSKRQYVELSRRHYSQKKAEKTKSYSKTVLLPKTSFPLRLDMLKRVEMDHVVYKKCGFSDLYEWQRDNIHGPEYVLHDGPPYANGKPHIGHAINKILKDITVRHKLLQGFKIHYVPGWDCHGLPIELKALAQTEENLRAMSPIQVRTKAQNFAKKAIKEQSKVFQSWGIMANWNNYYVTFHKEYIKNQIHQFLKLYEMGLIYQDFKPVFWSPSSRTALAEAELEYNTSHQSTAVYIGFLVHNLPSSISSCLPDKCTAKALIWTTTPWSLPANQAICYNPDISYCIALSSKNSAYILATELVEATALKLGIDLNILKVFPGSLLREMKYKHPLTEEQDLLCLPASHVTVNKGTGLVHTAPAHGPDDFLVALENNFPVKNLVDDTGCYTSEAGSNLEKLYVLEEGNTKVMNILQSEILHSEDYVHSYPYDWRTKKPVILKASQQWFIDTAAIKTKAVEALENVTVLPRQADNTTALKLQLEQRPYWCISRQRVWGVPIPVLYKKQDHKPIISRALVDNYISLLEKHGPDFWWKFNEDSLTSNELLNTFGVSCEDVEKGKDILDIWFDSGLSWSYVLGEDKVADLYLEGIDQFTGWFQSSLMTSVALRGKAPYKTVFVHGFAVDKEGRKMSKSLGNVIDPQELTHGGKTKEEPALGMDALRWWVACHATQHTNVSVSHKILQDSANDVQKIRLVLRFLLGVVQDFTPEDCGNLLEHAHTLDLYMLHRLKEFETEIFELYNTFQYHHVCKKIINFVSNDISSIYCHMSKDRLYCDQKDSERRKVCQLVMNHVMSILLRSCAPVLPFLAEEVYLHCNKKESSHLFYSKTQKSAENWEYPDAVAVVKKALEVKEAINKHSPVTNTLGLHVQIYAPANYVKSLKTMTQPRELEELLQVSSCEIFEDASISSIDVKFSSSSKKLCDRCRLYTSYVENNLCTRCEEVIKTLSLQL